MSKKPVVSHRERNLEKYGENMTRPVILIDLDNVVYDWAQSMAIWLIENGAMPYQEDRFSGVRNPAVVQAMRKYTSWSVWDDWNIPKGEFVRWWRLGIEAGEIYAKGPLVPGARDALWKLSDAEWDIHIATSRLTKFGLHDRIVLNTASWLRDNNIPYRNIHFTDDKHAIMGDAIVDDRADNMVRPGIDPGYHGDEGRQFLFPANHNQGAPVTVRQQEDAWEDIVNVLT